MDIRVAVLGGQSDLRVRVHLPAHRPKGHIGKRCLGHTICAAKGQVMNSEHKITAKVGTVLSHKAQVQVGCCFCFLPRLLFLIT